MRARVLPVVLCCLSVALCACGSGDPKRVVRGVRLSDLDAAASEREQPEAGMTATGRGRGRRRRRRRLVTAAVRVQRQAWRADDVAYVNAMLDDIEHDQCLDHGRVFVTGFSMGGYMSNQLGCQLGRARLRAIAPHSGGTHSGSCEGGPLPVLLLHGDADSLIDYRCGTQVRDYWVDRNGCSPEYDTWDITGGQCQFYRGCPRDAPVVLCTYYGLDHTWAYPPMYEFSTLMIWSFFSTLF